MYRKVSYIVRGSVTSMFIYVISLLIFIYEGFQFVNRIDLRTTLIFKKVHCYNKTHLIVHKEIPHFKIKTNLFF